jgi:eukaryotic-like serine/threonine-protein kinase
LEDVVIGASSILTPERWMRIKRIFEAVVDSPLAERQELLCSLCGGDSQLESEIRHLLAAENRAGSFLEGGAELALSVFAEGEASRSFEDGRVVSDRFEVRRLIARGGMGEVYEAWDRELQQTIALKTIGHDIYQYPGVLTHFKGEVKESLRITHPNVCRVYQLASCTDAPDHVVWFLTMELVDGPTLAQYLRQSGPMPYRRAYTSIQQMVSGLACAHELGIVHRDLKPGNLMIAGPATAGERLVITDFGLALSGSSPEVSGLSGTPAYMAPEQRRGEAVGPPADIWALGLIICEMMTGEAPELEMSSSARCRLELDAWLAAHPRLPHRMRAIVRRCLRHSPADRFQNAGEIVPLLEKASRAKVELGIAAVLVLAVTTTGGLLWNRYRAAAPSAPLDLEPLTNDSGLSWEPSLSADGKRLTYASDRNGPGKLNVWIQDVGSDAATQVTHDEADDATPELSPDGQSVAYRSYRDGGGIYIAPIAGGAEQLVAKFGRNPHFSPRGNSILYWTGDEHPFDHKFVPDGRVFLWSRQDASSSPMAHHFVDARYPVWSPDGNFILLQASQNGGNTFETALDFWVVSADGKSAVQTGAFDLLRRESLELFGCPFFWTGYSAIFSARRNGRASIWELPLGLDGRIKGPLTPLTGSGASDDNSPWVSRGGMLAVAGTNNHVNIWRVPMSATGIMATPDDLAPVTSSDVTDQDPSVSADGKTLVFKRRTGNSWTTIVHRTDNSKEQKLALPERSDGVVNSDGSEVAYSFSSGGPESIFIRPIQGGTAKEVCHHCGRVLDWSRDKLRLLYNDRGRLMMLDMASSNRIELLPHSEGAVFDEARFSPDAMWVALPVASGENTSHLEIVSIKGAGTALRPFRITDGDYRDRRPAWSPDGNRLFMYSNRDSFDCVWRVDLQPLTKLPVTLPQAVVHFHHARLSPRNLDLTAWRIAAGGGFLYLNLGEMSGNIFKADLNSR